MESQYQKWVNLSYFAVAALLSYLVFTLANKVVGTYDLEARIRDVDLVVQVGSVVVGMVLFFVLYRHEQANQFMNEVMLELSRVTWPSQKETSSATIVVMIMVLISGAVLGLLDYCWISFMKWIL